MPDVREENVSMVDDESYLENEAGSVSPEFKHVASTGALPWKNKYLIALSVLGLCVVLLALASFSEALGAFSWLLALASLGALGFLGWVHMRQQAWLAQSGVSESGHVNAAIDALSNHLKTVGSGDLTQPAPIAPGAMGRISEILDATFKSLSTQIADLQQNARRIEENAIETTTATNALLEQAQAQFVYQEQATVKIEKLNEDLSWIADQSRLVSDRASSALGLSSSSAHAVSGVSGKMDDIRAAAVDAGTRVSRLAAFSREMSTLIDALSRAADQAGVVALQAALQSEKAGAGGQGFRIVSDSMRELAAEIETLARRGSSITTAASSDVDASSHAVEQVIMGSDDVARLMDVAGESAQQSMETGKDLDGVLGEISTRARQCAHQAQDMGEGPHATAPGTRQAQDVVALVASVRELNQKLGRFRS